MTTKTSGRTLELFFIDGRPGGMLTAKVFGWTGHVLRTPRTQISKALSRQESSYTGVYILLGELDGEPRAYIGESENITKRIKRHETDRDWWTDAVLITTSANDLNKAHVKFLEARLMEEAELAVTTELENNTTPTRPSLSEAEQANMEAFLDHLFTVLAAIRVDLFIRNTRPATTISERAIDDGDTTVFELQAKKYGIHATAVIQDGLFVVQAGSTARNGWAGQGYGNSGYEKLFHKLKTQGVLVDQGDLCLFTESYVFPSPSAAGVLVNGRSTGGPKEWKVKGTATTYKQWEAEDLRTQID